jgi:hypothetical protein
VSLKQPELLAKTYKAWLAQSVERLTLSIVINSNQKAAGSSPASGLIFLNLSLLFYPVLLHLTDDIYILVTYFDSSIFTFIYV